MQETPITSASEVLNYHGDPNLAAGSGAQTMAPQINVAPIESTIDKLQSEEIQKRQQQTLWDHQAAGERDKFIAGLTNSGGSIFNMKGPDGTDHSVPMLPQDQKTLTGLTVKQVRYINAHPDTYEHDEAFAQMEMERRQVLANAQRRAMHDANNRLQYSQAYDPDDKRAILQNTKENIEDHDVTEFHPLTPYSAGPAISGDDFVRKGHDDSKNQQLLNDDGTTETYGKPQNSLIDPRKLTPGDPLYYKAIKTASKFINSPLSHDLTEATDLNKAVTLYNTSRKLTPDNPAYVAPPYDIDPTTGALSFHEKDLNKLPFEITAALNVSKHGQPTNVSKSAEDKEKLKTQQAQKTKMQHDMQDADDKLKLARDKYELDKSKESFKELEIAKKDKEKYDVIAQPVEEAFKSAQEARVKATKEVTPAFAPAFEQYGLSPKDYTVADIPVDENVSHMAGVQEKTPDGKKMLPATKHPEVAVYLKAKSGNIRDDRYLIGYKEPGGLKSNGTTPLPDHDKPMSYKIIPINEAINNSINSRSNYGKVKPEYLDKAQEVYNEMTGAKHKQPKQTEPNDEATIMARLVPAKVKRKDGTTVDIMLDPVTNKRYAK